MQPRVSLPLNAGPVVWVEACPLSVGECPSWLHSLQARGGGGGLGKRWLRGTREEMAGMWLCCCSSSLFSVSFVVESLCVFVRARACVYVCVAVLFNGHLNCAIALFSVL